MENQTTEDQNLNTDSTKEDVVEEKEAKAGPETENKEDQKYKEKFLYLAAEMDNMKKRFEREKQDLLKYGSEKLLKEMVGVIDNFERTTEALNKDEDEKVKNIVTGIEMIHKQFLSSLKNFGLEQIEALGKEFDPNYHEAMAQQPMEGKEDMEVIQEYEKGYLLNGRLLRPSKVVVVKN